MLALRLIHIQVVDEKQPSIKDEIHEASTHLNDAALGFDMTEVSDKIHEFYEASKTKASNFQDFLKKVSAKKS